MHSITLATPKQHCVTTKLPQRHKRYQIFGLQNRRDNLIKFQTSDLILLQQKNSTLLKGNHGPSCRCLTKKDDEERIHGEIASEKGEISPFIPPACRYLPTCSEYSMQAYQKYGVFKGTVLTAWRLLRCNPLGGSGYDPPKWFGES